MPQLKTHIGIVGTGIAGCSAAYFARKAFPEARISVYEADSRIGGRINSITFAGVPVELGATFLHSGNRTLIELINAVSLESKKAEGRDANKPITVGVWNGQQFVWRVSGEGFLAQLRLASQYGISLLRIKRRVDEMLRRWRSVDQLQSTQPAFADPADLLRKARLHDLLDVTLNDFLDEYHVSERVRYEICDPICRAIFNQAGTINAFAGLVALAGGNVGGGQVLSIRGGNRLLCENLLKASGASVLLGHRVASIRSEANGSITVKDAGGTNTFDAVIVAAPLETGRIEISAAAGPLNLPQNRVFQIAHVTCVAGTLAAKAFGLPAGAVLPEIVLTTESEVPFSVINPVGPCPAAPHRVYKIQSREPLSDNVLAPFFESISDVRRIHWNAYPVLAPSISHSSFLLAKGIYYVDCMESTASTLETQTVASKNVVELIRGDQILH
jgi:glycine/D-amino acid oxidase-like deaminating enzyme